MTCDKLCENKQGTVFTDKIYGGVIKCCKKGLYKNDSCPSGGEIELGECESSNLTDKLVDLVKKL